MRIGLIDVDGHNFPNIPLMKLSAWHKAQGDSVEWYEPLFSGHMDKVYMSKVFSFTPDYEYFVDADEVIKGGSGYCIELVNGKEVYHKERDAVNYSRYAPWSGMSRESAVFRAEQSRAVQDFNINIRTVREGVSVQEEKKKGQNMKVLVACEESQRVCIAFRERGHEAYSCDIQECSGGHPEWHIMGDVLGILNGYCNFKTMDGKTHKINTEWELIIAHPPCTYLSTAATQCHSTKCYTKEQIAERTLKRIDAMTFFMIFVNANCQHIAIENPTGVMNTCFRKPDQTIHPYYFAESVDDTDNYVTKKTGLWLKNLPLLQYDCSLPNPMDNAQKWANGKKKNWTENSHGQKQRSKTFIGVAKAMAEQWG